MAVGVCTGYSARRSSWVGYPIRYLARQCVERLCQVQVPGSDRANPPSHQAAECATPTADTDVPDAIWVEPLVVGEVSFTEWTSDGRLRHPSWRGLRSDK
ncbi:hypothetical protein AB0H00_12460 [Nocardia sp. NPDC023852]|uniref:ATP dependent DNA ligase n=1 Tax=Nocardia sp. NPDC023852 TaxID=3154697 RepID=UPI0033E75811